MRVLFDIGHPFHVHIFKFTIQKLQSAGHKTKIVARNKDITHQLLDSLGLEYESKGVGGKKLLDRIDYTARSLIILNQNVSSFQPDVCLSVASPYLALIARINNIRHIMFNNNEGDLLFKQIVGLFKPELYLEESYLNATDFHHKTFQSYLELSYLHPDEFQPDRSFNNKFGKNYIIVRFVSNSATHDIGNKGLNDDHKRFIIGNLSNWRNVWVSSEDPLPDDLKKFKLDISPEKVHDVIANADLVFGESATMCSEAAMLGVPSVLISHNQWGYIKELSSKYQLVHYYPNNENSLKKALKLSKSIIFNSSSKSIYTERKLSMLRDKKSLTDFIMKVIEK